MRRRADAKELAIESREQLFSMLVRNADDIYVMFSPDAYEVEYVSPNVEKLLGVSVEAVKNNIEIASIVIVVLSVLPVVLEFVKHRRESAAH